MYKDLPLNIEIAGQKLLHDPEGCTVQEAALADLTFTVLHQ